MPNADAAPLAAVTEPRPEPSGSARAVVAWEGPGAPIMLTLYRPDGEVAAVPLQPQRAVTLTPDTYHSSPAIDACALTRQGNFRRTLVAT